MLNNILNLILFKKSRQIEKTLPRSAWENLDIKENNDPLVEIKETSKIKLNLVSKTYDQSFYVRKTIFEKLEKVSQKLPDNLILVVIEGYRSFESQQLSWDRKFEKLKNENQNLSDEEIEKQVRLVVAKPSPWANHHCGGAVDVTLADTDGNLLDMGTPYPSEAMGMEWFKKFQMFSKDINEQQKQNRKILRDAMIAENFVWYPGEWWHYCWGDRMWAVYSRKKECFYGPVYLDSNKNYPLG
jgi:zinc D-Ala-D-Ala dipeptidase